MPLISGREEVVFVRALRFWVGSVAVPRLLLVYSVKRVTIREIADESQETIPYHGVLCLEN